MHYSLRNVMIWFGISYVGIFLGETSNVSIDFSIFVQHLKFTYSGLFLFILQILYNFKLTIPTIALLLCAKVSSIPYSKSIFQVLVSGIWWTYRRNTLVYLDKSIRNIAGILRTTRLNWQLMYRCRRHKNTIEALKAG